MRKNKKPGFEIHCEPDGLGINNKWAFTRWSKVVLARLPGLLCRWIASGITYGVVMFVAMNHVVILTACTDERVRAVLGSTAATSYLS
ncbi:MAG TPA: hypothetical protein VNZ27_00110 [Rhodanobacter sp.]|jgi:hypothetical protein|nr:hypothetical protein [Rhodanobacter sp.]